MLKKQLFKLIINLNYIIVLKSTLFNIFINNNYLQFNI